MCTPCTFYVLLKGNLASSVLLLLLDGAYHYVSNELSIVIEGDMGAFQGTMIDEMM